MDAKRRNKRKTVRFYATPKKEQKKEPPQGAGKKEQGRQ